MQQPDRSPPDRTPPERTYRCPLAVKLHDWGTLLLVLLVIMLALLLLIGLGGLTPAMGGSASLLIGQLPTMLSLAIGAVLARPLLTAFAVVVESNYRMIAPPGSPTDTLRYVPEAPAAPVAPAAPDVPGEEDAP